MSILDQILAFKKVEVENLKVSAPVRLLEQSSYFESPTISMKDHLLRDDKSGIIAEIKRRSPSKGVINPHVSIEKISKGYVEAGASAISILTDSQFFGGSNDDLVTCRKLNSCPILRKDFVIDEYQVVEARSIGADAILLIAAALEPQRLKRLCTFAHTFGLEVLMEVHNESELRANLDSGADLVGVNNRNLRTFELDVNISRNLAGQIPGSVIKVSESGIDTPEAIIDLKGYGFRGFLIGQTFMQDQFPEKKAANFIKELYKLIGREK
jgi:indole-3-glycerol phosphate synthase